MPSCLAAASSASAEALAAGAALALALAAPGGEALAAGDGAAAEPQPASNNISSPPANRPARRELVSVPSMGAMVCDAFRGSIRSSKAHPVLTEGSRPKPMLVD